MPLVDHHCHGVVPGDLDRRSFEGFLTEGFDPAPAGTSHFDAPVGLAIRRWCAPVLGLPPLPSPDEYLARRAELGAEEVHQRFLRSAGLEALLVETGHLAADLLEPAAMGTLAATPAHQVVRLETVAEVVARQGVDVAAYPRRLCPGLGGGGGGRRRAEDRGRLPRWIRAGPHAALDHRGRGRSGSVAVEARGAPPGGSRSPAPWHLDRG